VFGNKDDFTNVILEQANFLATNIATMIARRLIEEGANLDYANEINSEGCIITKTMQNCYGQSMLSMIVEYIRSRDSLIIPEAANVWFEDDEEIPYRDIDYERDNIIKGLPVLYKLTKKCLDEADETNYIEKTAKFLKIMINMIIRNRIAILPAYPYLYVLVMIFTVNCKPRNMVNARKFIKKVFDDLALESDKKKADINEAISIRSKEHNTTFFNTSGSIYYVDDFAQKEGDGKMEDLKYLCMRLIIRGTAKKTHIKDCRENGVNHFGIELKGGNISNILIILAIIIIICVIIKLFCNFNNSLKNQITYHNASP
jgi:hypothetical protein